MEDEGKMVMGLKRYRGGSFIEEGKLVHSNPSCFKKYLWYSDMINKTLLKGL
jgi:hypothetical protein